MDVHSIGIEWYGLNINCLNLGVSPVLNIIEQNQNAWPKPVSRSLEKAITFSSPRKYSIILDLIFKTLLTFIDHYRTMIICICSSLIWSEQFPDLLTWRSGHVQSWWPFASECGFSGGVSCPKSAARSSSHAKSKGPWQASRSCCDSSWLLMAHGDTPWLKRGETSRFDVFQLLVVMWDAKKTPPRFYWTWLKFSRRFLKTVIWWSNLLRWQETSFQYLAITAISCSNMVVIHCDPMQNAAFTIAPKLCFSQGNSPWKCREGHPNRTLQMHNISQKHTETGFDLQSSFAKKTSTNSNWLN